MRDEMMRRPEVVKQDPDTLNGALNSLGERIRGIADRLGINVDMPGASMVAEPPETLPGQIAKAISRIRYMVDQADQLDKVLRETRELI